MTYTFVVTMEIREAIYASLCHVKPEYWHRGLSELSGIMSRKSGDEIVLTDIQVSAILSGLQAAIDAQSTDWGDWTRAKAYIKAREFFIAETRQQFGIV